jgi:glycine dehydrogenase subunit 1
MGPAGMRELGELILQRANYAAFKLVEIDGVALRFSGPLFKEFVLDYAGTGKSVAAINAGLRRHGIFGGRGLGDLGGDLGPDFETCALTCVTEIHSQADIDRFADALAEEAAR